MATADSSVKITAEVDGLDKVDKLGQSVEQLGPAGAAARIAAGGVDEIGAAAQRAEQKATPAHRKISEGVQSISTQLAEVKALYATWLSAQAAVGAVSGIAASADAWANLSARIKLAVGDGDAFTTAFQGVQDVALRTNTSLEATGNLFVKLADAGKLMGLGQADALRLTETVNQAVQLSGASAQAADAAVTQLIQGLQGGALRGDEFNSVMEQSPRLAKALADGLGVTTGELRKLAEAGQLSASTVINALQGQAAAIEREFGKLPATIGRALTDLQTQWQRWIGQLDESSSASATVAAGIETLANNFDLVASSLINAGQAYLGWKAYNIAAEFLALNTAVVASTEAKIADTAATLKNTAATAANTAAQRDNNAARSASAASVSTYMLSGTAATKANTTATAANTAAKVESAAAADAAALSAGRFATALNLVKGFSLAFLLTNLVDIGKWLGDAAAKAMGWGKVMEENERQGRAAAQAVRDLAAADAELAQKKQLAADKALGLSEQAKQLVADFGQLTQKGETTAAALAKIGKDLDLSSVKGIQDAGAALDALAQRGKITGEQVRASLQQALSGQDLQKFEVQARAAFDGSEQGARRLAAALDAQLGEALRRTGLDAGALANGVNDAAQRAINDFDVLIGRLDDVKKQGADTGIALAASLDQAGKAATTEKAAQAVLERWQALGEAGLVTGEQLARGLEGARRKLDDLKPGINSMEEAMSRLGIESEAALKKAADAAGEAFEYIRMHGGTLNELRAAWEKYGAAARAANGGILPDVLRLQEELYKVADAGRAAGLGIEESLAGAGDAADAVRDKVRGVGDALSGLSPAATVIDRQYATSRLKAMGVSEADARANAGSFFDAYGNVQNTYGKTLDEALQALADTLLGAGSRQAAAPVERGGVTINWNIAGQANAIRVSDQASADALLRAIEQAKAARS